MLRHLATSVSDRRPDYEIDVLSADDGEPFLSVLTGHGWTAFTVTPEDRADRFGVIHTNQEGIIVATTHDATVAEVLALIE